MHFEVSDGIFFLFVCLKFSFLGGAKFWGQVVVSEAGLVVCVCVWGGGDRAERLFQEPLVSRPLRLHLQSSESHFLFLSLFPLNFWGRVGEGKEPQLP